LRRKTSDFEAEDIRRTLCPTGVACGARFRGRCSSAGRHFCTL